MVDEWFRFPRALGYPEDVSEEFFDDEEVWLRGECCVEGEYRAGSFEAVAWEMQFTQSVY